MAARAGVTAGGSAARPFGPRNGQPGRGRRRSILLAGTALAGVFAVLTAEPVLADGGAGGRSGNVNLPGGSGGTGFSGAAGSDGGGGPISSAGSGGGGGGAAGGGAGGSSGQTQNLPGRSGGTTPGQDGLDGVDDTFPSGGGGGAGGANGATVAAPSSITSDVTGQTGGNGGRGGSGGNIGAGGGGGGAGGYGVIVTGTGTISNTATILGGAGGNGGAGGTGAFVSGFGGSGGDGGVGLLATGAATIVNSGTIAGGQGGSSGLSGGNGGGNGQGGLGGVGIVGADLTIVNSGTISGGLAFNGLGARADAITLTGGTNFLTSNGGTLTGGIGITGSLTLLQTTAGGATGSASYANVFSGSGALIVDTDAGKSVTLTGTNTYSGGTTIDAGTLEIGSGGTLGTGAVVDNAALVFNASGALSVANAISGSGTLQQLGSGTTTLTGALSYTGLTTVSAGKLVLGDTTHSVTLPGDATVGSGSTLALANGSLGTGTITTSVGAGLVVGTTAGLTATVGSATVLNGGTTAFQNSGSAGTATLTNTGLVDFADTSTAASAQITNNGSGLLQFRNASTAGSATITTNSGAPGGVLDGAGTIFSGSASGGTSRQIVNAGGLLDITASNAGVTIGSLEGAGLVGIGGKILTVGANDLTTTFSGVIQNLGNQPGSGSLAGGLTKIGTGTLTLSGNSTYTGATTVSGGSLIIDGSIAASSGLVVDAGTLVGGTGALPSATISGTLSPGTGTAIGTLTVAGNLSFVAGSTYRVDVSPASADLTTVTGTATLAGSVSALFQAGTYIARNYVILSAGGGLGGTTFTSLSTTALPAGFVSSLSYTTTDVLLNLTAVLGAGQGLAANPQAVAGALNAYFNGGGALPPAFATVFGLSGAPLGAALTQLSGEPATGAQTAALQSTNSFLGLMLDPFVAGRGGAAGPAGPALAFAGEPSGMPSEAARAYARAMPGLYTKAPPAQADAPRWTVWGAAYGGRSTVDGNAAVGSHDLDSRAWGIAAGADYRLSTGTLLGFALAGGETKWATGGLGSGSSDVFQAGLYGSHRYGPGFVSAALAYAWHDATTTRSVTIAGPETLEGRFHPQVFAARLETGWRFGGPTLGFTPYAAGQVQALRMPGFSETATFGAGNFALSYADETVTVPRSELGAWADTRFLTGSGELILRGRAAWAHDFKTDRSLTPTFQALPGGSFVVTGATADADLALVSAAAEWRIGPGMAVIAKVDGELGETSRTLAGTGTLRVTW